MFSESFTTSVALTLMAKGDHAVISPPLDLEIAVRVPEGWDAESWRDQLLRKIKPVLNL